MRIGLLVVLSFFSMLSQAVPIFPGAEIFEKNALNDTMFNLAVGGMEKQDGVWQPEKSIKVSVAGQRITHEIGRDATVAEVFQFYANQYKPSVVKQLFSCEALDCGSSAQWANGYFGVRELYGPDRGQYLSVWLLDEGAEQRLVTLYVIQRGNKKVYAHVDDLRLNQPMQIESPRAELINTVFNVDALRSDELRDLARSIRQYQNAGNRVWLVGHAYGSVQQQDNVVIGKQIADNLAAKLAMLGVEDLTVDSVGMLAPPGEAAADRVAILSVKTD